MGSSQQMALAGLHETMAAGGRHGDHGEVFTRRWVVDLMLDLVGYIPEDDLGARVIVEPSCGQGAFLLPIVDRLAKSCILHGRSLGELGDAVVGFDLKSSNVEITRKAVATQLVDRGETLKAAEYLAEQWIRTTDFLLSEEPIPDADFVVGNPPYIRLENISQDVKEAYRSKWLTMRGRADIYVGFFEKGLSLLGPEGKLAFICADRWMRNQYGAQLRMLISSEFAVDSVIVMHEVDAFEEEVSAYPAITLLRKGAQGPVQLVDTNISFGQSDRRSILKWVQSQRKPKPVSKGFEAGELAGWFEGKTMWPAGSPKVLKLIRDLEERFTSLEDPATGTRIGIGLATGCDEVYIQKEARGVEADRLLPLLTASDIASGQLKWKGKFLINPWDENGLVDLNKYPGMAAYFEKFATQIRSRYVARKQPRSWYRTIDRVTPGLREQPKLLMPDIKALSHPVLDPGKFYPHHNLYFIVSNSWDLEVLGGILLSDIANLFIGAYCVKMRNGTYRFQAQYIRKIRVPPLTSISFEVQQRLRTSFQQRDRSAATEAAIEAYGISSYESEVNRLSAWNLHSKMLSTGDK